jgi:hypothetical protein
MKDPREQSLREQLACEEARLARIDAQREEAIARVRSLAAQLARLGDGESVHGADVARPPASTELTTVEKLALFARRFRGRPDVFAKRWTNSRFGRSGYAPACRHEWVKGICDKPRIRCGDCPNQAFLPVTDQVLLDHLLGRLVVGVYPLLGDETCWFLAADFDGESWQEDVGAFVETCGEHGVTPAVERSRSGQGAHVWFFFAEPVPAASARNLGSFLISETMSRRHQLPMTSYDRLFPSQDTLPKGGFGNLIALPFQDGSRQAGNSVFLGEGWKPVEDQWGYLASTQLLGLTTVQKIVADAYRRGGVLGPVADGDDEAAEPWRRRPSGRPRSLRINGPLPLKIEVVVSQRLFVPKEGLPSPPRQPHQAARRVLEPGVPQETEPPAFYRAHSEGHLVHRGASRPRRTAPRMPAGPRGVAR